MKKITLIGMAALMLGIGTLSSGCFGEFALTRKLYTWNKEVTSNKFVNNLIFWVFEGVLPVYGIALFVDGILNLVEFWTGSNPMAMKPGDVEHQIVKGKDGKDYKITATQNRFDINSMSDNNKVALFYTPASHTWNVEKNGTVTKIATIHEDINKVEIFKADGSVSLVDMSQAQVGSLLQPALAN